MLMTQSQYLSSYQESLETVDVAQGQGDVDEHDGVADHDSADVTAALSVDLILDTPLRAERYGQVGIFEVFHEPDESKEANGEKK